MPDPLLALHVAAGTTGLLLGPVWLALRLGGHRAGPVAAGYQAAVAAVSVSGGALAVLRPGLAWLLAFAVLTPALALAGAAARRRGWARWRVLQPHLLGESYVALATGALVASTGNPLAWLLPAVVAQVPIAMVKRRLVAA